MQGKSAGQGRSDTNPEGPEQHADTEEVTSSNPVWPTIFENLSTIWEPEREPSADGFGSAWRLTMVGTLAAAAAIASLS